MSIAAESAPDTAVGIAVAAEGDNFVAGGHIDVAVADKVLALAVLGSLLVAGLDALQ